MPVWDQWDLVPVLEKAHEQNLTFYDLWKVHNEHHLFFPRIIMLVLADISSWNISYELYFNVVLAVGIFLLWTYQIRTTRYSFNISVPLWIIPVISFVVFSLNQWEIWLWGWNIQIVLNIFCVVGAVVLLANPNLNWRKFILAVLLTFIATYSYATGIVFWLIGIILLLLLPMGRSKMKKFIILWGAAGTICIYIYFLGYQKPLHHPALSSFLEYPWKFVKYVFVYLGTPLLSSDIYPQVAFFVGLCALIIFIAASVMLCKLYKKKWSFLLPYFSLSSYALASAVLTGIGRAGFGERQAMSSRYISFSNCLWIPLLAFLFLLIKEKRIRYLVSVSAAVIVFLVIQSSLHSVILFRERQNWLKPAQKELYILKDQKMLERIYPHVIKIDEEEFKRRLNFLKEQNLSLFRKK